MLMRRYRWLASFALAVILAAAAIPAGAQTSVATTMDDAVAAYRKIIVLMDNAAALDEGIPNTFPEAALRNRAIIGTQVGAASEWIEPGRTGFICAAPTVDLLADALREAWSQRQHWRHMGQASGIHARAYYLPNDYLKIVAAPPRG